MEQILKFISNLAKVSMYISGACIVLRFLLSVHYHSAESRERERTMDRIQGVVYPYCKGWMVLVFIISIVWVVSL